MTVNVRKRPSLPARVTVISNTLPGRSCRLASSVSKMAVLPRRIVTVRVPQRGLHLTVTLARRTDTTRKRSSRMPPPFNNTAWYWIRALTAWVGAGGEDG